MKRPFAVTGFVYLAVLAVALFLGKAWFAVLGGLFVCGLFVCLKTERTRRRAALPAAMIAALAAVLAASVDTAVRVEPPDPVRGKTAFVSGLLCELPYEQYGQFYYPLQAEEIMTADGTVLHNVRMLVSASQQLTIAPYDRMETVVSFYEETDIFQRGKGYALTGTIHQDQEIRVTSTDSKPPYAAALNARQFLSGQIASLLPENSAGFVSAILIGDRQSVTEEDYQVMRKSGMSHVMAVSGFHLSFLTCLLLMLLRRLFPRRKRLVPLVCMAAVVGYMALTGFSGSILRAGIMQLLFLAGMAVRRETDPLNSLGLSVLLITLIRPFAATDVSLLLSFTATLGILLCAGYMQKRFSERLRLTEKKRSGRLYRLFRRGVRYLFEILSVSISAFVFSLPVMILYFRQVPLWGIPANLLTVPVLPLLMVSALLMLVFHLTGLFSFAAGLFAAVSGALSEYILWVAGLFSRLPFATLQFSRLYVLWWMAGMLLIVIVWFLTVRKRLHVGWLVVLGVTTLVTASSLTEIFRTGVTSVAVLEVGDGLSVVLVEDHHAVVLACGGEKGHASDWKEYLNGCEVQDISYLLLPDVKNDTARFAPVLLEDFPVDTVEITNEEAFHDGIRSRLSNVSHLVKHDKSDPVVSECIMGDLKIAHIETKEARAVFVDLHGLRLLLCRSETDCRFLPEDFRRCEVLVLNGVLRHPELIAYEQILISDHGANRSRYDFPEEVPREATYDGGHLIVRVDRDNHYQLRREKIWLS